MQVRRILGETLSPSIPAIGNNSPAFPSLSWLAFAAAGVRP